VPARDRSVAVRCKWTEPGGRWRKDREEARRSQPTYHSKGFWDDDETERDRDMTNRGFPHQRSQARQAEASFDRESDTATLTVNEPRCFPTAQNAKRGAKQVQGKGENQTS